MNIPSQIQPPSNPRSRRIKVHTSVTFDSRKKPRLVLGFKVRALKLPELPILEDFLYA
jgi:hypothetical protein